MNYFVITDIEGVAGIDSFTSTRSTDRAEKAPAMDQLAHEVNACIDGIRSVEPQADITVWDGHGSGGLRENDVTSATYLDTERPYYHLQDYDAVLFVGQHAMAGTVDAPLRHTYSSRTISHYRLNGTFIGEFGCRALIAGRQSVPTIFLSGDDKATHEAQMFVPEIETVSVKRGMGEEAAIHKDPDVACEAIRSGAATAVKRIDQIPPYDNIQPPYELEIRYTEPMAAEEGRWDTDLPNITQLNPRTVQITVEELASDDNEFDLPL